MQKEFGLALGWGAARGLAHIGALKYIEENNIKITEVSGTSMGSIVWALFATWKTSDEIYAFAKSINYFLLLDFDLKLGLLKGNKVVKKLKEVFGEMKIEDTKLPLSIMTTNIETGERICLQKGSIVDAIRASISLPTTFIPSLIDGQSCIDGGIVNNLPIEALKKRNIIAISATKQITWPIQKKRKVLGFDIPLNFFEINYQILQRSFLLMMEQNEEKSLQTKGKNITFIKPDFTGLEFFDFLKTEEFHKLGYKTMQEQFRK